MGSSANTKITIIYAYFVIFLLFVKYQRAVLISERDSYRGAVNSYFLCEAVGYVPGRCRQETLKQYSRPLPTTACKIVNIVLPTLFLLYLFNCTTLKARVKEMEVIKMLRCFSSRGSTNQNKTVITTPMQISEVTEPMHNNICVELIPMQV